MELGKIDLGSQVILLVADTALAPTEAGTLAGHHGSARIVFHLPERPSAFTVEITGTPDVPKRTLTWPHAAPARQP